MSYIIPGKIVYLSHPRTASMAVESALERYGGIKTPNHHAKWESKEVQDAVIGGEIRVTTVRDPFDILLSWYWLNKPWHEWGFRHFILKYNHNFLAPNGRLFYHYHSCNFIMRYRKLQDDFDALLYELDMGKVKLPIINKTIDKPKNYIYTPAEHDAIMKRFRRDIDIYLEVSNE